MNISNYKKYIKNFFIITMIIPIIGGFNYLIDPYGIYNTNMFSFNKCMQFNKIRLVKVIKTEEIKPKSIVLGTSRAEYGYDPTHPYFIKPSYNLAISGSSMYETKLNFKNALKQGNLTKVLLVADYRMFNALTQNRIGDFETYFENKRIYRLLFSIDVLKDSLLTISGYNKYSVYLENGQIDPYFEWKRMLEAGGHLNIIKNRESKFYRYYPINYTYRDTKKESFPDFEEIVKLCYENNIELDIIFGPSHIRLWEVLNYRLGYDKWLQWKKDVVISVNKVAKKYNQKQFRIMDFSVYHTLTSEKVPTDKNAQMIYHWDSSHYKNELGLIVLDRLIGNSKFNDFGVEINKQNIDEHLNNLKINRYKFIDVNLYKINLDEYLKM